MDNKENVNPPPKKKSKLSLSLRKKTVLKEKDVNQPQFCKPVEEFDFVKAAEGIVPLNRKMNTKWAESTFLEWVHERNTMYSTDLTIPADILQSHDEEKICEVMCYFAMEVRREDGERYPAATLRSLLSALNRTLKSNKAPFSILDRQNIAFRPLMLTLDSISSDLHRDGVDVKRNSAMIISKEDEDRFWEKGLLGTSSPRVLRLSVFFYIGLQFCSRGVEEQHRLVPSQFERFPGDISVYNEAVFYTYCEYISKNNQHRFKDVNSKVNQ